MSTRKKLLLILVSIAAFVFGFFSAARSAPIQTPRCDFVASSR